MKKLKKCRECGSQYGQDERFSYGCPHHAIVTKFYKVPKDLFKILKYEIKIDINDYEGKDTVC